MTDSRGRAHRPVQRVPAAPLVEWLAQRLAAYEADVTTPRLHQHGVSPAVRMLSEDLGISDRTLYRYSRSLSANGQPTNSFRRSLVQDMLESAGVRFDDIYPDIDPDVVIEPLAFCPTCEVGVNPIGGECPWCNTGTRKAPRGVRYNLPKARVSDHQLRSLHMLHVNCKLPILVLARQSHARLGYASGRAADRAIRRGWQRLGLKPLTQSQVMTAIAARKQHEPLLEPQAFERALWMHAEAGVSVEAIGRLMVTESRVTFSGTLARWLRDEFRTRGVYSAKRAKLEAAA